MSACKWCEGSGIVLLAGERHDSIERCESCARFVNKAEAFAVIFEAMKPLPAAKPTPPPASPLKFESLKEMGEHIARLAAAFKDSASEFEEFSGWEWRWCPMSSVLCGAMERPSHYRLKPAPVKPREWWGVFVGLNELMEITPIRAEAIRFSQARLGSALRLLIEWPEGAELPDLPA